jgi:hypothetical protein
MNNNMQTEKNTNKKNNQRPGGFQNSPSKQGGSSMGRQNRGQQTGASPNASMVPLAAVSAAVTSQLVDNFAPRLFADIKEYLAEQFGDKKVESWLEFFQGEEGDDTALYSLIRNAIPSLPEEFNLSNFMEWEPIRLKIKKNPVATAAIVATGVGALYLTREYLKTGNFSMENVSRAVQNGKAKLMGSAPKASKRMTAARAKTGGKKLTRAQARA